MSERLQFKDRRWSRAGVLAFIDREYGLHFGLLFAALRLSGAAPGETGVQAQGEMRCGAGFR